MITKIYCFIDGGGPFGLCVQSAFEKDGKLYGLCGHISSDETWAKHDIGLTSDWKHDTYKKEFPEGYELEWVNDIRAHPVLGKHCRKS